MTYRTREELAELARLAAEFRPHEAQTLTPEREDELRLRELEEVGFAYRERLDPKMWWLTSLGMEAAAKHAGTWFTR